MSKLTTDKDVLKYKMNKMRIVIHDTSVAIVARNEYVIPGLTRNDAQLVSQSKPD